MKKHLLTLLAVSAMLSTACSDLKKPEEKDQLSEATNDTAVVARENGAATPVDPEWDMSNATLANLTLEEIDLPEIAVRGDDRFSVYSIEETVLFDTDKADIKPTATRALSEIGASIGRRHGKGKVRVMGFADSRGDANYNRELSAKRAEAVKNWFMKSAGIGADRISIEPMGESAPVASNATAEGRQQNRRVEIAVLNQ